jgi:hypothetical protein
VIRCQAPSIEKNYSNSEESGTCRAGFELGGYLLWLSSMQSAILPSSLGVLFRRLIKGLDFTGADMSTLTALDLEVLHLTGQ